MAFMTDAVDCLKVSCLSSAATMVAQVMKNSVGLLWRSWKMAASACCRIWLLWAVWSALMMSYSMFIMILYIYTKRTANYRTSQRIASREKKLGDIFGKGR
jgi:hypothetical protein